MVDSSMNFVSSATLQAFRLFTSMQTNKRSAYLWTSGYVPRLDTYMGPDTPNPLYISVLRGDKDIETVLGDVLALSRINFNTCLINDREPVTIRFADAIGDILESAPVVSAASTTMQVLHLAILRMVGSATNADLPSE